VDSEAEVPVKPTVQEAGADTPEAAEDGMELVAEVPSMRALRPPHR